MFIPNSKGDFTYRRTVLLRNKMGIDFQKLHSFIIRQFFLFNSSKGNLTDRRTVVLRNKMGVDFKKLHSFIIRQCFFVQ